MSRNPYDVDFFSGQWQASYQSARQVVPKILSLVVVNSVLDVGCGVGAWLKAFMENGVQDIIGIDGQYVETSHLLIEASYFHPYDLVKPFSLGRTFDLAICLEVAEHLPENNADVLFDSICLHSTAVLFSAAIPGQGGTHHVNEQWPSYWIRKFSARNFIAIDCIRPLIWDLPEVECHYPQNTILFLKDGHPKCQALAALPSFHGASLVHPNLFKSHHEAVSWRIIWSLIVRRFKIGSPMRGLRKFLRA